MKNENSKNYSVIEITINDDLYKKAIDVLKPLGYTIEEACVIFINELVRQGKIPFPYGEDELEAAKRNNQ